MRGKVIKSKIEFIKKSKPCEITDDDYDRVFYICSYGGSGSKLLQRALDNYGKTYHVHSRNPPNELTYVGNTHNGGMYCEFFNNIKIPDDKLYKYTVIYIYRNPIKAIYSRFQLNEHLFNIQSPNKNITIQDVINKKDDLYGIEEFYDNYTKPSNRNYKIHCIKYEDLYNYTEDIAKELKVDSLNIEIKETKREYKYIYELNNIYRPLLLKMTANKPHFIS